MAEFIATRSAVTIAIPAWRAARGLEDAGLRRALHRVGRGDRPDDPRHRLGRVGAPARGSEAIGAATRGLRSPVAGTRSSARRWSRSPTSQPIQMASASGVWMTDMDGRRYLDAYNNVPCVGHAIRGSTEAVARQARLLNTNMRYLHESAIELAERLVATCPDGLDTVLFVNSGSEANDLAWRMATAFTGNAGGLCTELGLSRHLAGDRARCPRRAGPRAGPDHVETWAPPDTYRGHRRPTRRRSAPRSSGWRRAGSRRRRRSSTAC